MQASPLLFFCSLHTCLLACLPPALPLPCPCYLHSEPKPPCHALTGLLQIRDSIKSLFPDRDCFTLVRPLNDEEQLARLDSLPPSEMRPEFK